MEEHVKTRGAQDLGHEGLVDLCPALTPMQWKEKSVNRPEGHTVSMSSVSPAPLHGPQQTPVPAESCWHTAGVKIGQENQVSRA